MIRTKMFWIGLALVCCCLLFVVILTSPNGQAATAPTQTSQTSITPSSRNLGIPALHSSFATTAVSSARFTIADVQTYVQSHPFVGGPIVKGTKAGVVSIQFITSTQASALMQGEETGLPPTATVCYVKFQGPFTLVTVPVAPGAKQLPDAAYGVEIFDAQTGNLLMWWIPSA